MTPAITRPQISLEEFLAMPETEPASEYIDGQIIQKPMPKGQYSRIQAKLVNAIDTVAVSNKIALALPELRCSFGGLAIVPDVAVFKWERVPFTEAGFVPNDFEIAPDWAVEILSPNQSPSKPVRKLAHCLQHGTEVGWLIDPGGLAVTAFYPNQIPVVLEDSDKLPTLSGVPLELTVDDVFGWLRIA